MSEELVWSDTLAAPRSLATRDNTAVALIEDFGIIEIARPPREAAETRVAGILGTELPMEPWQTTVSGDIRIAWTGPLRWRVICARDRAAQLRASLADALGDTRVLDLTGAYSSFRIVGATAREMLARVCPLDLRGLNDDDARGTTLAGVRTLLVLESRDGNSWLALVPRSFAEHVAMSLTEAARTPGSLALFAPAEPPPV
jgi:heterotetrameric sarcosine oxidase gamma subunit